MNAKEVDDYVMNCPYFGGKNTIDRRSVGGEYVHIGDCSLEFHYRPVCPGPDCHCAKILGLTMGEQNG